MNIFFYLISHSLDALLLLFKIFPFPRRIAVVIQHISPKFPNKSNCQCCQDHTHNSLRKELRRHFFFIVMVPFRQCSMTTLRN